MILTGAGLRVWFGHWPRLGFLLGTLLPDPPCCSHQRAIADQGRRRLQNHQPGQRLQIIEKVPSTSAHGTDQGWQHPPG